MPSAQGASADEQAAREVGSVVNFPMRDVHVDMNIRRNIGSEEDMRALAESMKEIGLLHPVVIHRDGTLLVGSRRYLAARRLGWETIRALVWEDLTDLQRVRLQLMENVARKGLEQDERLAAMALLDEELRLRLEAEKAERNRRWEEEAKKRREEEAKKRAIGGTGDGGDNDQQSQKKGGERSPGLGGRGKTERKPGSKRDRASRSGVDPQTAANRATEAAMLRRFPLLTGRERVWTQGRLIDLSRFLKRHPDLDRDVVAALVSEHRESPVALTEALGDLIASRVGRKPDATSGAYADEAPKYPFMRTWANDERVEGESLLGAIDAKYTATASDLVDQPGTPPEYALRMLRVMLELDDAKWKKLIALWTSDNEYYRGCARSLAIGHDGIPDPHLRMVNEAIALLKKVWSGLEGDDMRKRDTQEQIKSLSDFAKRVDRRADVGW